MPTTRLRHLAALAFLFACAQPAAAPAPAPAPARTTPAAAPTTPPAGDSAQAPGAGAARQAGGGQQQPATGPRPYNRVITGEARTRSGLFKVHTIADRLYFEIPARELDKDMLIVGRLTRAAAEPPQGNT